MYFWGWMQKFNGGNRKRPGTHGIPKPRTIIESSFFFNFNQIPHQKTQASFNYNSKSLKNKSYQTFTYSEETWGDCHWHRWVLYWRWLIPTTLQLVQPYLWLEWQPSNALWLPCPCYARLFWWLLWWGIKKKRKNYVLLYWKVRHEKATHTVTVVNRIRYWRMWYCKSN